MYKRQQLGISITDIFDEREMVEVHAQEEELILHTYRNLPEDKKKAVLELSLIHI